MKESNRVTVIRREEWPEPCITLWLDPSLPGDFAHWSSIRLRCEPVALDQIVDGCGYTSVHPGGAGLTVPPETLSEIMIEELNRQIESGIEVLCAKHGEATEHPPGT
jgi:hypothetical protein